MPPDPSNGRGRIRHLTPPTGPRRSASGRSVRANRTFGLFGHIGIPPKLDHVRLDRPHVEARRPCREAASLPKTYLSATSNPPVSLAHCPITRNASLSSSGPVGGFGRWQPIGPLQTVNITALSVTICDRSLGWSRHQSTAQLYVDHFAAVSRSRKLRSRNAHCSRRPGLLRRMGMTLVTSFSSRIWRSTGKPGQLSTSKP